jgi:hypothetical protein
MTTLHDELVAWLRDRPPEVWALALRSPPGCTVEATKPYVVPAPGTTGRVVSYFEADDEDSEGLVGVLGAPGGLAEALFGGAPMKAQCCPSALRVVATEGATRADVERALAVLREEAN